MRITFIFTFWLWGLAACSQQTKETTKQEEQPPKKTYTPVPISALDPDRMVPVGMCRIVGTVISIDSTLTKGTGSDPCSKAPCMAMVKVDSVLGCGLGVTTTVSVGSLVRAKFSFTVLPTKDLFPNMDPPLPGLNPGSRFKALIKSAPDASGYLIDTYEAR